MSVEQGKAAIEELKKLQKHLNNLLTIICFNMLRRVPKNEEDLHNGAILCL